MSHVTCPECGYRVGLGVVSEPGRCPTCDVPLMLTMEMRALAAPPPGGTLPAVAAQTRPATAAP
jgi:hypothetical protein